MGKIDFKKELRILYQPSSKKVEIVDVQEMNFMMIDGLGTPYSREFQSAVQALYGVTFAIKMMPKKGLMPEGYFEYVVPPVEGLWWIKEGEEFDMDKKDDWRWTLMIMQPAFVTDILAKEVLNEARGKKDNPALSKVRFESFHEGLSAQIMHIGPYASEGAAIDMIHEFAEENNFKLRGKHHEIYLSDPRRTNPEKLRTVIRYPVRKIT